jgi:DNA oxidative demethylase
VATRKKRGLEDRLPPGLVFVPEFLTLNEENNLLSFIETIVFRTIQMRGVTAKRRIKQFGWHYSFESYRLTSTDPIPGEFTEIGVRSAAHAGIDPAQWAEALVTEYSAGSGIGWHRDAPAFGVVAGISLSGTSRMRFQTGEGDTRMTSAVELPPRSLYVLNGEVRTKWQHMIPPTRELRYSITFRTLRQAATLRRAENPSVGVI